MSDVPPTSEGSAEAPHPGRHEFRHAKPPPRRRWALKGLGAVVVLAVVAVASVVGYGWYRYNQIGREDLALAESVGGVQNFLIVGSDTRAVVDPSDPDYKALGPEDSPPAVRHDHDRPGRPEGEDGRSGLVPPGPVGADPAHPGARSGSTPPTTSRTPVRTAPNASSTRSRPTSASTSTTTSRSTSPASRASSTRSAGCRCTSTRRSGTRPPASTSTSSAARPSTASRAWRSLAPVISQYKNTKGQWVDDPSSDLGRIARQQYFLRKMVDRSSAKFGSFDIKAMNDLVSSTSDKMKLDSELSLGRPGLTGQGVQGVQRRTDPQPHAAGLPVHDQRRSLGAEARHRGGRGRAQRVPGAAGRARCRPPR